MDKKELRPLPKTKKITRIKRENQRLRKRYEKLPEESLRVVDGLIDRAAYLRPTLEEMEIDIDNNGSTEMFSQGKEKPYERERPVVRQYNSLLRNYQSIIKQLDEIQPQEEVLQENDGFDSFVLNRD